MDDHNSAGPVALDPIVEAQLERIREAGLPRICDCDPIEARRVSGGLRRREFDPRQLARVEDRMIAAGGREIAVRSYVPRQATADRVVVHYHGGGWVLGSLDQSAALCAALAAAAGCEVLSVDYRLAPEHPFPAAVDDAFEALGGLAASYPPGTRLVLCGDSAGGNLAALAALRARDAGGPEIALQVLVYPIVDPDFELWPAANRGRTDLPFGPAEMAWFWDHYLPDPSRRGQPDAAPLRAESLANLPPAIVVLAGYDPLLGQGRAYAIRLTEAGVDVTLREYGELMHGFFGMVETLPQASSNLAWIGEQIGALA
jgi:acetyl esterase